MNFYPIEKDTMVYPGEYLLHVPSQEIILCGAYKKGMGIIKGMAHGRLMEAARPPVRPSALFCAYGCIAFFFAC